MEIFSIDELTPEGEDAARPRFNVAPTTLVPAIVDRYEDHRVRKLVSLKWGLVPHWAKDPAIGSSMINARVETVATKPSYRKAFAARRCLLPAAGYYEWQVVDGAKQPWFLKTTGEVMAMAGIYELQQRPEGWLATCSIITTTATDEVGRIHDRMPMTVTDIDAWLDPDVTNPETARALLTPLVDLEMYPVSTRVNSVRNDDPSLIEPVITPSE